MDDICDRKLGTIQVPSFKNCTSTALLSTNSLNYLNYNERLPWSENPNRLVPITGIPGISITSTGSFLQQPGDYVVLPSSDQTIFTTLSNSPNALEFTAPREQVRELVQ